MANSSGYPVLSFHFSVDIGIGKGEFQEVSGIEVETETEEYAEGGVNNYRHKLPKHTRYSNLVLKKGITPKSSGLLKWIKGGNLENLDCRAVTVRLLGPQSNPLMTWTFEHAFPVKWAIGNFNAQESAVAIDTLEIAYREFKVS